MVYIAPKNAKLPVSVTSVTSLNFFELTPRVLYIVITRMGGVEDCTTDRVMTCSLGNISRGQGRRRKEYAVNVPLRDEITDETFKSMFKPVSFLWVFSIAIKSIFM